MPPSASSRTTVQSPQRDPAASVPRPSASPAWLANPKWSSASLRHDGASGRGSDRGSGSRGLGEQVVAGRPGVAALPGSSPCRPIPTLYPDPSGRRDAGRRPNHGSTGAHHPGCLERHAGEPGDGGRPPLEQPVAAPAIGDKPPAGPQIGDPCRPRAGKSRGGPALSAAATQTPIGERPDRPSEQNVSGGHDLPDVLLRHAAAAARRAEPQATKLQLGRQDDSHRIGLHGIEAEHLVLRRRCGWWHGVHTFLPAGGLPALPCKVLAPAAGRCLLMPVPPNQ